MVVIMTEKRFLQLFTGRKAFDEQTLAAKSNVDWISGDPVLDDDLCIAGYTLSLDDVRALNANVELADSYGIGVGNRIYPTINEYWIDGGDAVEAGMDWDDSKELYTTEVTR